MEERRVVVTGIGSVSSVGATVDEGWGNLVAGRSGIGPLTRFDGAAFRSRIAGEVKGFDVSQFLSPKEARRQDLFVHYAIAASQEAMTQSGLDVDAVDPPRFGVFVGSGIGGLISMEIQVDRLVRMGPSKVSPFLIPQMISDMAAGALSMRYGAQGPNFGIVSACATGSHCLGEAFWTVKRGDADIMLAGGAEAPITPLGVAGFCALKAMSERNDEPERASRPYDAERDGFVIAEGAGVLLLESEEHAKARGAEILAEFLGYGATADAYHVTAPAPGGEGAARAIGIAIEHAGLRPDQISYVNAHGTSTKLNDKCESMALKTAMGEHAYRVPVSSTKSLTGHALGAAGGIETVTCVKALIEGVVPGTYNYENKDPDCDLDYVPNESRECDVQAVLNMNFGFGGHNGVLALGKYTG